MNSIRRAGVIADYGSLTAYREHVVQSRSDCLRCLARAEPWDVVGPGGPTIAELRRDFADWEADLAWVNAEIAKDV